MKGQYSQVTQIAQDYYNSDDADNFYFHIWGGEDIHIGIYETDVEDIAVASRRTVRTMAQLLGPISSLHKVVDLGAGYGGAARFLAQQYGCRVDCINLSEIQNQRNREFVKEAGLESLVNVVDGNFEKLPYPDQSFDFAWSQDSFLHSGEREKVFKEIDRVLKPGGKLIFTDPMQNDRCPDGVLQPVLDRIHLDSLGSLGFYRNLASELGWRERALEIRTEHLVKHYARVRQALNNRKQELSREVSAAYIERMLGGLQHWVDAGNRGYLCWGVLVFEKPQ